MCSGDVVVKCPVDLREVTVAVDWLRPVRFSVSSLQGRMTVSPEVASLIKDFRPLNSPEGSIARPPMGMLFVVRCEPLVDVQNLVGKFKQL